MIKKYNEFLIKESSEVEEYNDIRDIFSDMTDNGFKLEVVKSFFTESGMRRDTLNTEFKIPGIKISLRKKEKIKLSEKLTLDLIGILGEAIDRMSDFGEVIIREINLNYEPDGQGGFFDSGNDGNSYSQFRFEIYILQKEKKVEISDKDGFYDFIATVRNKFNRLSNQVTNSFTIEQGKDEIILVPKEGIDSKQLLSATKSQLKKFFDPWHMAWRSRLPYEYTYDVKLDDNKIYIIYKERFRIDRSNRRIEE
jgi:hypothetical protein